MYDIVRKLRHLEHLVPRGVRPVLRKKVLDGTIIVATLQERILDQHDDIPVPPPRLRFRIGGYIERKVFIQAGETVSEDLMRLVKAWNGDASAIGTVLDFGCGCGRVIRHMRERLVDADFYGVDIDPEGIEWCQENLAFGKFSANSIADPMDFPAGLFDFIYGISVLTHLDEDAQNFWLAELNRVSQPGALLILTVHGGHLAKLALDDTEFANYLENGFFFHVSTTGKNKLDGLPDFYQTSFHAREYVEANWAEHFDVLAYVPRAINNHQDAVVLRKPDNSVKSAN